MFFSNKKLNYISSINQAFEEYSKKNFKNAYSLFDTHLDTLTQDSNLLQQKNMIYINLEKYELILDYLEKILSVNPRDVEILLRKCKCYQILNKMEQAIQCFEQILSIQSSNLSALRYLVLIFINLGKYEQALDYLEKILSDNPTDFEMIYFKAIILEKLGQSAESVNNYLKSLKISSTNVPELQSISLHMVHLLGKDISMPIFKRLLENNPDNVLALEGMKNLSNPVYEC
jgi:tetratricopeptide (TPR) repeat protein